MRDFYLCHNPLGKIPAGRVAYIYHPDTPRIFSSVIEIDPSKELLDFNFKGCNVIFEYDRPDGKRRLFLMIVMQGGARNMDTTITLLREAAGWYCTCLNKEELTTYGKPGSWSLMRPYNKDQAPNLEVLHIHSTNQYLISYGAGTFCTEGIKELHIIIDLLYKDEDGNVVEQGDINYA